MKQVLFAWIMFSSGLTIAQTPQFRHYTVNDGLANSMVYYAMQDSKGYMWFCTESGVNRFDGRHFEVFTIKDGLADNENFRCMEDSKGRIWFLSYNGKLSYFNGRSFVNEKSDPSLKYNTSSHKYFLDMIEDPDGNIWFSKFMSELVYKFDGKEVQEYPVKSINGNSIYYKSFLNFHKTVNYFRFTDEYVFREELSTQVSHPLTYPNRPKHESITLSCRQVMADDHFYFITNFGLRHFRNDSVFMDIENKDIGTDYKWPITSFTIKDDNLWMAIPFKGLVLIRDFKKKKRTGKVEQFLGDVIISHILSDSEGGIWLTTLSEGIYYIPASFGYITNTPEKSVTAIKHSGFSDKLGIGTYYCEFKVLLKDSFIHTIKFDPSVSTRIKGIKWLSETKLLLGTDYTPYVYDMNTKQTSFLVKEGQIGFSDLDEGPAGTWIEGRTGIFLINGDKKQCLYGCMGPDDEKLISIAEGGMKGCWFASIRDLHWLELKTKKSSKIAGQELFNSNLKDLKHVNGYLWVATDGNGIFVFKDGKPVKHIHSGNAPITSDVCQKLVHDGKENIWVATNKGISVFNVHTYNYVMSLTSDDILINDDIKDIDLYGKNAYVATPAGISIIDVDKFITVTDPPKVYLKDFFAAGINYSGKAFPTFDYYNGIIKLTYTAITFQARQSIRYRYKINNKENTWNETNAEQLEFYNLNPGTYEVLISAKKYNSVWSDPVSLKFTVLPLWYQSAWFKLTIILTLLLIICFIVYRILKTNKRKSETERKILESELRAIRLHMNPHFIFNTLNSLQLFIFKNKSLEANDYIAKFSRLMRWIMAYSDKQEITLKEEIEFLKTYIELEQLRFEKGFSFTLSPDAELNPETTYIPPLVIQPFVENAIKYGLAGKDANGILQISFEKKGGLVFVVIEDNGVGRRQVQQEQAMSKKRTESTGIKYTEERLKLLFRGVKVKLPVKIIDLYNKGKAAGTRVELIIPLFQ